MVDSLYILLINSDPWNSGEEAGEAQPWHSKKGLGVLLAWGDESSRICVHYICFSNTLSSYPAALTETHTQQEHKHGNFKTLLTISLTSPITMFSHVLARPLERPVAITKVMPSDCEKVGERRKLMSTSFASRSAAGTLCHRHARATVFSLYLSILTSWIFFVQNGNSVISISF